MFETQSSKLQIIPRVDSPWVKGRLGQIPNSRSYSVPTAFLAMPSADHPATHFHHMLDVEAQWQIRENYRIPDDLPRYCKANTPLEVKRGAVAVTFAILVSAGCSHVAAIEIAASLRTIKVTVYHLRNGFEQKWTVSDKGSEDEFKASISSSWHDADGLQGGMTEDGQSVLLIYNHGAGPIGAYIVNANGFTRKSPPSHIFARYLSPRGQLSEDSEYLFYIGEERGFAGNRQTKVVEAYSIRHLARMRATTFRFGDGRYHRNTQLLSHLHIARPVHMVIETHGFGGEQDEEHSPSVIASSDKELQWNFANMDSSSAFISHDNAHLFHMERNTAKLQHWDLNNPTLRALGNVTLPGVEQSQSRKWLIHGKETLVNDAIPDQMHQTRFSPKCKLITVVTMNDCSIVINVLLTFNLQLIYHHIVQDPTWPYLVPARIGFTESNGLNIFAMSPAKVITNTQGLLQLFGISGVLIPLPKIFAKIKAIEHYFDSSEDRLGKLTKQVGSLHVNSECKFGWRPGFMERNKSEALSLESGPSIRSNETDVRRQRQFYEKIFADKKSTVTMESTPKLWRFFMPHLFSFEYEWDSEKRVSVFGIIMKNEYYVIAIGPSPESGNHEHDVIRTLYASDIRTSEEDNEFIEVHRSGPNYFLHVYKRRDQCGAYSGAPMPCPRWTIISPHFLEEDAWYDTFIIHRARSVTTPDGWIRTPNPALSSTTNYQAYFEPYTFSHRAVVDYGHRARSAYVVPKYLLWQEYGLRRLRKPNSNEVIFGGGGYADALGGFLRSIYDDKTYNESAPLFPTAFALACNEDYRAQTTERVDAFFRRLHQERKILLDNCHAISCTLPLACRARPTALLSFMRHIAAYPHKINDIGAVETRNGPIRLKGPQVGGRLYHWMQWVQDMLVVFVKPVVDNLLDRKIGHAEPYITHVTLPLSGFCSFRYKLYRLPPGSDHDLSGGPLWAFIRAAYTKSTEYSPNWDAYLLRAVQHSGAGAASPFTRIVEEILAIQDRELQLSFLRIPWLEKLLAWKMNAFGLHVYLTRTVLPMLLLFLVHFIASILLTEDEVINIPLPVTILACIEALASCFILSVKVRQIYRIPRLFFRSIFNYIEGTALCLGLAMFFLIVSKSPPSRAFLGFSTLCLWIGTILMLRVYRPIGILLLLLTETIQEIFSFLILLSFVIIGMRLNPWAAIALLTPLRLCIRPLPPPPKHSK